ncbi:protein of unknown function (plasmid) [Streptantibioticus cattleyicolor NRRL 8057 = DSM 46488]|nr:protein of unknown function [Streptantibioticus cattleyicolor NRRL 8057 = DSM 46488]
MSNRWTLAQSWRGASPPERYRRGIAPGWVSAEATALRRSGEPRYGLGVPCSAAVDLGAVAQAPARRPGTRPRTAAGCSTVLCAD